MGRTQNSDYTNYLRLNGVSLPTSPFIGFNTGGSNMENRNTFMNSPFLGRNHRMTIRSPILHNYTNNRNAHETSWLQRQNTNEDLAFPVVDDEIQHSENLSIAASDLFVAGNYVNRDQSPQPNFNQNYQSHELNFDYENNQGLMGYHNNPQFGFIVPSNEIDRKKNASANLTPIKELRKFEADNNSVASESLTEKVEKPQHLFRNDNNFITPNSRNTNNRLEYSTGMTNILLDSPTGTQRHKRGLKMLSVRVRDIVYQKKRTTYKEVADTLIAEDQMDCDKLNETAVVNGVGGNSLKIKKPTKKKAKLDANVKRRVYDALNVLIAADVLEKQSKLVVFNNKSFDRNFKHEMTSISKYCQNKEYNIRKKKIQLTNLVKKYIAIKSLIDRNASGTSPPEVKFPF